LIDAAINNTEKVMSNKPGFISADFHKVLIKQDLQIMLNGKEKKM
jgi:hypothetical protein